MTKHLLTFSGFQYHDTTRRIVEDSPKFGVDEVWVMDDYWLRTCRRDYWSRTKYFREHPGRRGVDFFCFKSFVMLDMMRRVDDGDVVLWLDADTVPIADLTPLYERCVEDNGKMFFNARGCVNKIWTKRDAFLLMGCDEPKYHDSWQCVGRFMLLQKGSEFPVDKFLGEWLGFTCNPIINTFDPSVMGLPDYPGFREHRCEQSVLTNLAVKYGCKLHREACEFGCWLEPEETPAVPEQYWYGVPYQMFSQTGKHSYRPGYSGDTSEGSFWCNVND